MFKLERQGTEPAIVFVHGFCQASAYWAPTLERLAQRGVHGLAVDLPGFGASAGEAGPYTMEGLADTLARQLDDWGIGPTIVLVGGSMGGVVAQ
ncbi:MAG: alpha/beta fold hydrolase, partial [Betaproteobacteria bacterium]